MVIREQRLSSNQIKQVLAGVLGDDLHAKRVASLSDATLGAAAQRLPRGLRAGLGRPRPEPQACDQAGGSPALQPEDQRRRYPRQLGALYRRRAKLHRGGVGLDRLRCR